MSGSRFGKKRPELNPNPTSATLNVAEHTDSAQTHSAHWAETTHYVFATSVPPSGQPHSGLKTPRFHLDSACSQHMTPSKAFFTKYSPFETPASIEVANGAFIHAIGTGSITLPASVNDDVHWVTFTNVFHVPAISRNLLSVRQLASRGVAIEFTKEGCLIRQDGKVVLTGSGCGNLYNLDLVRDLMDLRHSACVATTDASDLWHRRLGHLGNKNLQLLASKHHVLGLPDTIHPVVDCEVCAQETSSRNPFPKSLSHATDLLELVHSDVVGPLPPSLGGAKYLVSMGDDKSRRFWVFTVRSKKDILSCYKMFEAQAKLQSGKKIRCIRTDNGSEYTSAEFAKCLADKGKRHQFTIPYSPQQNGRAERFNRTIFDRVCCMLTEARLPISYWSEAAHTAVYLMNRSPHATSTCTLPDKDPVRHGKAPVSMDHATAKDCSVSGSQAEGLLSAAIKNAGLSATDKNSSLTAPGELWGVLAATDPKSATLAATGSAVSSSGMGEGK